MTQLHRFALLSAVLVSLAACNVYDAALIEEDAGAEDSGTDTDTSTGQCNPRRPPSRPESSMDGDDGEVRLFALENIQLEQAADWTTIGYDLDGRCTTEPTTDVECVPHTELVRDRGDEPPATKLDGLDGIDNVLGSTFYQLVDVGIGSSEVLKPYWQAQEITPNFQRFAREQQALGVGTVMLRVSQWNGEPDDARVTAEVVQSAFGTPCNADGTPPEIEYVEGEPRLAGGDPLPPPAWDGKDCWWIHPEAFTPGGTTLRLSSRDAYVRDGTLVFRLAGRATVNFYAGILGVKLIISDSIFTVDLRKNGGENFIVAGRWSLADLMEAGPGVGICPTDPLKRLLDEQLAAMADVLVDRPGPDTATGPDVECSAISMGVRFERIVPGTWVETAPSGPAIADPCENPPMVPTDPTPVDPDAGT